MRLNDTMWYSYTVCKWSSTSVRTSWSSFDDMEVDLHVPDTFRPTSNQPNQLLWGKFWNVYEKFWNLHEIEGYDMTCEIANDARNDFQRQKDASNDNRAPLFNFTAIYRVFDTIE